MDKVDNNNIPDWFVRAALGKPGEAPIPGNTRGRWGQRLALGNGQPIKKQAVATDTYPMPVPWAVSFRFSLDGIVFTSTVPAGFGAGEFFIEILKGIDQQSTPSTERITMVAGDVQPFCNLIAQSLQIVVGLDVEGPTSLWVEVVATIVTNVDCADLTGGKPSAVIVDGYSDMFFAGRVLASTTVFPNVFSLMDVDPLRRQFVVQNYSDTDVGLAFSSVPGFIDWTPGAEQLSMILKGGITAIYESPVGCYRGKIVVSFKPGGPTPTGFLVGSFGR